MRTFNRVSRQFLAVGMLAGALFLTSCGNYALYKIQVTTSATSPIPDPTVSGSKTSVRENIDLCLMTITDENGAPVVQNYDLKVCGGAGTKADLGLLSYSTSRTSGTLTFQVDGWSTNKTVILQTGKSDPVAPQAYPPEMPQINVAMK
jgi:hypothetical protein